jgi:hypothetical protein
VKISFGFEEVVLFAGAMEFQSAVGIERLAMKLR